MNEKGWWYLNGVNGRQECINYRGWERGRVEEALGFNYECHVSCGSEVFNEGKKYTLAGMLEKRER